MNFKSTSHSLALVAALCIGLASCGPKDADIKTAVETQLKSTPGVVADVKDGIATLSGTFTDDASKAAAESAVKAVKGVKSVVDNAIVAASPVMAPAPVVISTDDALKSNVAAALKNFTGLSADVKDGIVTLSGEIKKADLPKVMMTLSALHPKKIMNKATIK